MDAQVSFSTHAEQRCVERNISMDEVLYVVTHGRRVYNAGSLVFFLGKRDIPHRDRSNQRIAQLEGLTVQTIQTDAGWLVVMTVYRNRERGFKDQRRKRKYDYRKEEFGF
jgi:hypothetical protein